MRLTAMGLVFAACGAGFLLSQPEASANSNDFKAAESIIGGVLSHHTCLDSATWPANCADVYRANNNCPTGGYCTSGTTVCPVTDKCVPGTMTCLVQPITGKYCLFSSSQECSAGQTVKCGTTNEGICTYEPHDQNETECYVNGVKGHWVTCTVVGCSPYGSSDCWYKDCP
jgi:hypothetical protein